MNDISERVRRAGAAKTRTPWRVRFEQWRENVSLSTLLFVAFQLVMLVALTAYEAFNSASGWEMIARGAAPSWLSSTFGAALTVGYIAYHRKASECHRIGDMAGMRKAAIVAFLGCALALFGVFSNLASKTALTANEASENNSSRTQIIADIRLLESTVTPELISTTTAIVEVTERQIASLEGEAVGWGMSETSPAACAADLRSRQRSICNSLNGTGDGQTMGLRNELALNKSALENLGTQAERLAVLKKQLSGLSQIEGQAHWEAMTKISAGNVEASSFRIWGTFIASALVLLMLGFGWDSFCEKREQEFGIDAEAGV